MTTRNWWESRLAERPVAPDCYHTASVISILRSLLIRLTRPLARRLFVGLLVAVAWLAWAYLPPWPIAAWDRPSDRVIDNAVLAPDSMTFVALERGPPRGLGDSATLWHLSSGRAIFTITERTRVWEGPRFSPDGSG